MASKVLRELEDLRSMLAQPTSTPLSAGIAMAATAVSSFPGSSSPMLLQTPAAGGLPYSNCWASSSAAVAPSYGRLGRALEAAEEEMDAAMERQADIVTTQLRARELDLAEAQRAVAAATAEAARLRNDLAAAKQQAAASAIAMEARLAAREAELSTAHAELLALRGEADDLKKRLTEGQAALNRADVALSNHTAELSHKLQTAAANAEAAAAAASRERQDKEALLAELAGCQAELCEVRDDLASAARELDKMQHQVVCEAESRHQLQSALERAAAAAAALKEAKDLEISELRRRLRAERGVRKACEVWLQSELRSREEMEGLLMAVRDMVGAPDAPGSSGGSKPGDNAGSTAAAAEASNREVAKVEALLAKLNRRENAADAQLRFDLHPQQQQPPPPPPPQQQQSQQQQYRQQQPRGLQYDWNAARATAETGTATPAAAAAAANAAGSISRLLAGEAEASKARREFVQMKAALGEESRRLKAELAAAKQMLRARMTARDSACRTVGLAAAGSGSEA